MSSSVQLKLFDAFEMINIDWLFDFLKSKYPKLKFQIEERHYWFKELLDDDDYNYYISSKLCKKVQLKFDISRFSKEVYPSTLAQQKYIGVSIMKQFDDYWGFSRPIESFEELNRDLPKLIQVFLEKVEEYKTKKDKNNDR